MLVTRKWLKSQPCVIPPSISMSSNEKVVGIKKCISSKVLS